MAFRNPNGTPGAVGFGMMPYHQQMYMPGNMNMALQQQQQRPRPGGAQFMQPRPSFPGMTPQRYPIMQQGMTPQQGTFPPQMYAGQVAPQQGVNMQQQQIPFQQQQQVFAGQPQQVPSHMQQQSLAQQSSHQRQVAGQQKKDEEQVKKERYFQEQQRKLKQFGKVGGKVASVDSLNINLDEMFGKGVAGKGGGGKEAGRRRPGEGTAAESQPQKTTTGNSPALEDDGFGDFLQGPTPPANTPQTPEAGPLPPQGQHTSVSHSQPPTKDEGFGEFLQGHESDECKDTTPVDARTHPLKGDKKVLSLESMMLNSADLTAPNKPTKVFHPRKTLRESESTTQAHRRQTFVATAKAKPWSSAESISSIFSMPETHDQSGVGLAEHGQGLKAGSSTVAPQGGEGKGIPAWCLNEPILPLVYRQVLEASLKDDSLETNLLYPILMLSGLDKPVLGHIWGVANQTIPGQLTRQELYIVLGLISLAQNGQQPTIEALHHFREAPLPVLTPKGQSGPQMGHHSLSQLSTIPPAIATHSAGVAEKDVFAAFQEAPGIISPNVTSSQQAARVSTSGIPSCFTVTSDNHKHADNGHEEHGMDATLKFPKEEENCYIFAGSPADSSSGRSSPLVWDPNSIYDKLTCRSQESVSSGSLSDRTPAEEDDDDDDDDEFHDFKSAPKPTRTSNPPLLASLRSIAPPKSHSSGTLSTHLAAAKQSKFAMSAMHSFDSLSQKKGASYSREDQKKIDLFHMDFEKVFPKVGRKTGSASTDDFGSFQAGSGAVSSVASIKENDDFGDFAHFKHSASESDLMGMQPAEGDKYAVFRDLTGDIPQVCHVQTVANKDDDDFDDFKQADSSQEKSPVPAALSSSDSFSDFTETTQSMAGFTANFQDANFSIQPTPPSIFEPSQTLPTINLSPSFPDEEQGFADFKQAIPMPPSNGNQPSNVFNLKSDSASTSSSEDKYSVLRVLGGTDDREPPDDDFGDFQTNSQPPIMDSLSQGLFINKPGNENIVGNMKKPVSASDLYGMEFDTLGSVNSGSVAMLNLEDAAENEPTDDFEMTTEPPFSVVPNPFQSLQNSKLAKLESIDRLDLKTFDLDLTLGRSAEMEGKDRGDSFGEFSSAPMDMTSPVENADQGMQQSPIIQSHGVSSLPLLPSGSSLIGDRYSEVVGNVDDENRHAIEWQRCLEKCHKAVKKANNVFNNISSSSVCIEVIKSSEGSEYLSAVIEIYRVACRIVTSMNAMGVESTDLQRLQKDIELVWTNLSAFLAASALMPAAGSFVFKTAVLRPEPTNTDRACGVCLLSVDSRSKAFDHSKDSNKLVYGGRQYHATCANLWVNMVDSILPALPLNRLL